VKTYLIRNYWYTILYNVVIQQTSNVEVFDPEESYDVYWCDAFCVGRCFILKAYILLSYTLVYYILYTPIFYIWDWCVDIIPLPWLLPKNGDLSLKHLGCFKFTTTYNFLLWIYIGVYECSLMCSGICCWVICIWYSVT
jgi:hypothetical protein